MTPGRAGCPVGVVALGLVGMNPKKALVGAQRNRIDWRRRRILLAVQ